MPGQSRVHVGARTKHVTGAPLRLPIAALLLLAACAPVASPVDAAVHPDAAPRARGWLRVPGEQPRVIRADGTLPDGRLVLDRSDEPLSLDLPEGSALALDDGALYGRVDLDGQPRWLEPAHSRREIDARQALIDVEISRLPLELQPLVRAHSRIIAVVSAAEGDFDGIATHAGDPAASLGLFQWATARSRSDDDGSSLARLFGDLARRATSCESDAAHAFFCAAARQHAAAGLAVRAGRLLLHGHAATGAELEPALRAVIAEEPLRAYQLVAANDWIERIASLRVTVDGTRTSVATLFHDEPTLAMLVLLGVNRPSYVVPAVERARGRRERLIAEALVRYRPREREQRARRLLTSLSGW